MRNCFTESQFYALKEYFDAISEKDKHEQIEKIASALKTYSPQPHTHLIEETESKQIPRPCNQ